ncbi:hypothetical protein DF3PB_3110001 [uncultured Defluviicoccus sp.]|uniref:Uncharacterized protein n=1 Tax=metagenome TaxID=256318 RepID=A0A380TF69_9ZZZZ|nr:hypothetical protein DF3PB_3110001 [uncultured Defluviicoccus sp.]
MTGANGFFAASACGDRPKFAEDLFSGHTNPDFAFAASGLRLLRLLDEERDQRPPARVAKRQTLRT